MSPSFCSTASITVREPSIATCSGSKLGKASNGRHPARVSLRPGRSPRCHRYATGMTRSTTSSSAPCCRKACVPRPKAALGPSCQAASIRLPCSAWPGTAASLNLRRCRCATRNPRRRTSSTGCAPSSMPPRCPGHVLDGDVPQPFAELPDRPLDEPSRVAIMWGLFRNYEALLRGKGVRVLLSGYGGDQALFGDTRRTVHLADRLRRFQFATLMREAADWQLAAPRATVTAAHPGEIRRRAVAAPHDGTISQLRTRSAAGLSLGRSAPDTAAGLAAGPPTGRPANAQCERPVLPRAHLAYFTRRRANMEPVHGGV